MKDYGIALTKYAEYFETRGCDCMVYEVKFKDGHKEYISRELFNILSDLLETANFKVDF